MLVLWLQDFLKRSFEIYSSCKGKILTLCVCVCQREKEGETLLQGCLQCSGTREKASTAGAHRGMERLLGEESGDLRPD